MFHCYKHVVESTEVVRQLVGGSSGTSFQLNERQCQILAKELVETNAFLEKRNACSKFGEGVESIILRHLCSAVQRTKVLVKKCCCKDLESWLVSAMMLVEIQEEFMAIILDIHLWRMLLDFAITCGRGLSREKKAEEMKIMDEEYHQLFKDLRRESHALQQAALEDKETIISRTSNIAETHGSKIGLDYLRAIYLQSWLTSSAASRDVDFEKCEYLHLLGQGGCGAVMKVKWLGIECALKMLGGQDKKEATALKGLFHPNIIRLFHYWEDCPENPQSRLLMELMPQDLGAYMVGMSSSKMQMGKDSMPFSLPVAIDIMYQIAQAMHYMHDRHLTHRDLKPANILVKERPRVSLTCIDGVGYLDIKLADFGLVKSYTNTSTFQTHSRNRGTGMYRAPEVFGKDMTQKRHYLPMADVWSFGITCAEILSGKPAYTEYLDDYGFGIQSMICKEGLRPTLPKHCPPYLAFCIKSCWEYSPSRRPSFASLCKLLRHAKLLSLGVTKLDDSKVFFAYTTRSDHVRSLDLSPSASRARISTFFQSSLKFMGIGPRRLPSVAEVLPVADILPEERVVSTPMVTEESPLANEDGAGSIAAHANPTQMVKSLPDLQESEELTQASLDTAISPLDASDPIQPAIGPRKNLGRVMLTTKVDGGKFANIREAEEEVSSSGNRPKKHSGQRTQRAGHLLSHFPNGLEASASNSPAALNYQLSVPITNLPKPPPPFDLEVIRNNESREAVGYQIRDPPPGSHQDDVMRRSPKTLMMAVMGLKSAVNHFAEVLITNMNKHPVELEYLKQTILREVGADLDRADLNWNFLVEAFICKRLFDGFDSPNRCFGLDDCEMDRISTNVSYADFFMFKGREATISMLLDLDSPDGSFLGRLCFKKFKSISGDLSINQPLPIYREEWDAVERERHPKTMFYRSFLKVAVSVWMLHGLMHSFEEKGEMLIYEKGAKFQWETMKSVVPGSYEEEDEEAGVNSEVGFSVIPGFKVNRSVVKCEVYLRSRNIPPYLEITGRTSTKKTLVKTPSNRPSGKTLSAKTYGKFHTPQFVVRDSYSPWNVQPSKGFNNIPGSLQPSKGFNNIPGSLQPPQGFNNIPGSWQPPEGFSSSSNYVDHYPSTQFGDAGSSGLEVHPHWDARRDSLTPGNQGSVNQSGRKSRFKQESSSEAFAVSQDRHTNMFQRPLPTHSSNHRGADYVVQDPRMAAGRRLANTKPSPIV